MLDFTEKPLLVVPVPNIKPIHLRRQPCLVNRIPVVARVDIFPRVTLVMIAPGIMVVSASVVVVPVVSVITSVVIFVTAMVAVVPVVPVLLPVVSGVAVLSVFPVLAMVAVITMVTVVTVC
mgnify:CR=1 FL=1|jgi:hypothetical protein